MDSNKVKSQSIADIKKERFFDDIKNYIIKKYEPAKWARQPDILFLSTKEVYNKMQFLFPSMLYKPEDIALWLKDLGFVYIDMGNLHFEWMFRARKAHTPGKKLK